MKRLLVLLMLLGWQESVLAYNHFNAKCIIQYLYLGKAVINTINTKTYYYPDRTQVSVTNSERTVSYGATFELMASTETLHYFGFPLGIGISASPRFWEVFNASYSRQQSEFCGPYNYPGYFLTRTGRCQPYLFQSGFSFDEGKLLGIYRTVHAHHMTDLNNSLRTVIRPLYEYRDCSNNPNDCWTSATIEERPSFKSSDFKVFRKAIPRPSGSSGNCSVADGEFGLDDDPPPPDCPDVVVRTIYQVGTVSYDCN